LFLVSGSLGHGPSALRVVAMSFELRAKEPGTGNYKPETKSRSLGAGFIQALRMGLFYSFSGGRPLVFLRMPDNHWILDGYWICCCKNASKLSSMQEPGA
jgi:hypothetical protein